MNCNKALAIVGPTATGKSKLALEIANKIPSEIISADSMQIYKGMDIGTAKVSKNVRQKCKHHLIDIVSIDEPYNVVKYQKMARAAIVEIQALKKVPIIVGGSGLYVRATIYKLDFPPDNQGSDTRIMLEKQLEEKGLVYLQNQLRQKNKDAFEAIDVNNSRRLVRALEVINTTDKPYSTLREDWHNWQPQHNTTIIGLTLPREQLYERIDRRVEAMIEAGLIEETKKLVKLGLKKAVIARQALGYKELIEFIDSGKTGEISLEEAINTIKKRTRNYAKRQLTWFKKDPNVKWYDVSANSIADIAEEIINQNQIEIN